MDERDLTGRDIEEAKNWGLTPRKYMELREQLNRKFQEADKSKMREDITKEVFTKAKDEARKELDEARARQVPTEIQREVVTEYLAKYEVECATLAETASALAEDTERQQRYNDWRRVVLWALPVILAPLLTAIYLRGYTHTSLVFWATIVPIVITHIWNWVRYEHLKESLLEVNKTFLKIASDYLILQEDARRHRVVTTPTAETRREIQERVEYLADSKRRLDDRFTPYTRQILKGREQTQANALAELDPREVIHALKDTSSAPRLPESVDPKP